MKVARDQQNRKGETHEEDSRSEGSSSSDTSGNDSGSSSTTSISSPVLFQTNQTLSENVKTEFENGDQILQKRDDSIPSTSNQAEPQDNPLSKDLEPFNNDSESFNTNPTSGLPSEMTSTLTSTSIMNDFDPIPLSAAASPPKAPSSAPLELAEEDEAMDLTDQVQAALKFEDRDENHSEK